MAPGNEGAPFLGDPAVPYGVARAAPSNVQTQEQHVRSLRHRVWLQDAANTSQAAVPRARSSGGAEEPRGWPPACRRGVSRSPAGRGSSLPAGRKGKDSRRLCRRGRGGRQHQRGGMCVSSLPAALEKTLPTADGTPDKPPFSRPAGRCFSPSTTDSAARPLAHCRCLPPRSLPTREPTGPAGRHAATPPRVCPPPPEAQSSRPCGRR